MENAKKITVDKHSKGVQFISIIGIVLGVITVLIGILFVLCADGGTVNFLDEAQFGADFYTYVYEGIYEINETIADVTSYINELTFNVSIITILIGAFEILLFVGMFVLSYKQNGLCIMHKPF